MNYNYSYIYSLLKDITIKEPFFADGDFTYNIMEKLKVPCYQGMTKFVIAPKTTNFVIKLPFDSVVDDFEDSIIESLVGALGDMPEVPFWDYCAYEVFLYKKAQIFNLQDAFPKTEYIGLINNWPVYIQEKCIDTYDFCSYTTKAQRSEATNATKISFKYPHLDLNWFTNYFLINGQNKSNDLLDFLEEYNINDLHKGNLGFSAIDSRPLIIDFSGFHM